MDKIEVDMYIVCRTSVLYTSPSPTTHPGEDSAGVAYPLHLILSNRDMDLAGARGRTGKCFICIAFHAVQDLASGMLWQWAVIAFRNGWLRIELCFNIINNQLIQMIATSFVR